MKTINNKFSKDEFNILPFDFENSSENKFAKSYS